MALTLAVSTLEVEFRDLVELYDISVICLIQDSHKKLITKKHKAIDTCDWAVETIAGESDGAHCYLALLGRNYRRREQRGRLLPGTVCLQNILVCGGSEGVVANGGRADCCGKSQQGPAENGQSGGGNVGLQENSAHILPVAESVLMYDHFIVTLAI